MWSAGIWLEMSWGTGSTAVSEIPLLNLEAGGHGLTINDGTHPSSKGRAEKKDPAVHRRYFSVSLCRHQRTRHTLQPFRPRG
jgi:hypothetical protein